MTTQLMIDTSSEAQLVAVSRGEEIHEQFRLVGRGHSREILPTVISTLEAAGIDLSALDVIVLGRGPGSFTGVRIAAGVVQGLAFGLDIPVVPVSTLAVLAQDEHFRSGAEHIVVALSAREDEVFFGSYSIVSGIASLNGHEAVYRAAEVPRQDFATYHGIGSGWSLRAPLEGALGAGASEIVAEVWPRARAMSVLGAAAMAEGRAVAAGEALPEYLREQVARKPG